MSFHSALKTSIPRVSAAPMQNLSKEFKHRRSILLLYRSLLDSARLHDRHPTLKLLMTNPFSRDSPLSNQFPLAAHYCSEFFGSDGFYYLPNRSATEFVRSAFRNQLANSEAGKEESQNQLAGNSMIIQLESALYLLRALRASESNLKELSRPPTLPTADPAADSLPKESNAESSGWRLEPVISLNSGVFDSPPRPFKPRPARSAVSHSQSSHSAASLPPPTAYQRAIDRLTLQPGMFLVAHPALEDEFHQTVILIVEHSDESGTVGVVINNPVESLREMGPLNPAEERVLDIYKRIFLSKNPDDDNSASRLMRGGPVSGVVTLHRYAALSSSPHFSSSPIIEHPHFPVYSAGRKFWSQLKLISSSEPAESRKVADSSNIQIFLGKCTWTPNQLREELKQGTWALMNGSGRFVFDAQPNDSGPIKPKKNWFTFKTKEHRDAESAAIKAMEQPANNEIAALQTPDVGFPLHQLLNAAAPAWPRESEFPIEDMWRHAMFQLGGDLRYFSKEQEIEEKMKKDEDDEDDENEFDDERDEDEEDEDEDDDEDDGRKR